MGAGGAGGGSGCVSVTNDRGRASVAPLRVSGDETGIVIEPMYTVLLIPFAPATEPESVVLPALVPMTLN